MKLEFYGPWLPPRYLRPPIVALLLILFICASLASARISTSGIRPGVDIMAQGTKPFPIAQQNSNSVATSGSSSAAGNQDATGTTMITALAKDIAENSSGARIMQALGGATFSGVQTQISGSSYKSGTNIVQYDNNSFYSTANFGIEYTRRNDFNAVLAGDLATAVTNRRVLGWVGTDYSWGLYRSIATRLTNLVWGDYPGAAVNALDYWQFAPSLDAADLNAQVAGEIPPSYQISNRSHPNAKGEVYLERAILRPLVDAAEGGPPWFPYHIYYTTLSTAQTNGGDVQALGYRGDLTSATLSVLAYDKTPSADFGISVSGSTATLIRTSATTIKDAPVDLWIRATKAGRTYDSRIALAIGNIAGTIGQFTTGPDLWLITPTNDNLGSNAAPNFSGARILPGMTGTQTEFSFVADITPATNGDIRWLMTLYNNVQIQRTAANAIDVGVRDTAGTSHGGVTSSTIATAGTRLIVFYSCNVASGVTRQRLTIVNAANSLLYNGGSVTTAGNNTLNINPAADGTVWWSSGARLLSGVTRGSTWTGKRGIEWMANKEIDWTVSANRAAMLATDFSTADASHSGDGRSIIVQSGGTGIHAGETITPFYMTSGHAGDYVGGHNRGSGGDFIMFMRRNEFDPSLGKAVSD